jgi:hypothetical protein
MAQSCRGLVPHVHDVSLRAILAIYFVAHATLFEKSLRLIRSKTKGKCITMAM